MLAWLWAIAFNAFAIPVAFALPRMGRQDTVFYAFALFPICGAVLLFRAIRVTLQYLKFGNATFNMLADSGAVGGTVAGVVVTNSKVQEAKRFRLVLRCIQRVSTGTGKNRHTEERVLWEDWRHVKEMGEDSRQSGIPVCFEIPSSCSSTNPAEGISWKLEVSAEVPGIDFLTVFDIPLTRVAEQRSRKALEQFEARYVEATDMPAVLARQGVKVQSHGNGLDVRVAPARHQVMALMVASFTAALMVGFVWFVKPPVSIGKIFTAGIFGIFLLFFGGALATLCGVSSLLRTEGDTLQVTKRWFGVPFRRTVARDSICSLGTDVGMSAGYTTYHNIVLITKAGKKTKLVYHIRGQRDAHWLAAELRRHLRLE